MKNFLSNKCWSLFLSALMIISIPVSVFAENDTESITVKEGRAANSPFAVENMFPGDSETKDYKIRVEHEKRINLYFTIELQPGSEKLAEVMMVEVSLPDEDVILYDGLMKDIPSKVVRQLSSSEHYEKYRITAYLDTSVGNDYMNKNLKADFRWWYAEEGQDSTQPPVDTGDNSNILMYTGLTALSGIIIILLIKKKKDEEEENG